MHAMILAAGFGTRFQPYTNLQAKPSLPFFHLPMIAYPLYYLENYGIEKLVVNVHHLPETVLKALKPLTDASGIELIVSHEKDQLLGTGGGIGFAKEHLKGHGHFFYSTSDPIMMLNHHEGLKPFMGEHFANDAIATMLTCDLPGIGQTVKAVWSEKRIITGFGLKAPTEKSHPEHFTGFMVLNDEIFDYIPQGPSEILLDAFPKAFSAGQKVKTYFEPNAKWFEIGNKDSYFSALKECIQILKDNEIYGRWLGEMFGHYGTTLRRWSERRWTCGQTLPKGLTNYDFLMVDENASIENGAEISGFVILCKGAKLQAGSRVRDAVIGPGCVVTRGQSVLSDILL